MAALIALGNSLSLCLVSGETLSRCFSLSPLNKLNNRLAGSSGPLQLLDKWLVANFSGDLLAKIPDFIDTGV